MIKNYYLTFLIFCCGLFFGYGQITDDFTDGNFTATPVWSGNTADFSILTSGTLPNGTASTDGSFLGSNASTESIALTTPSTEVSEWQFSLGSPSYSPSASNSFGIILMSNTAVSGNITGSSWNGYYLKIGVNGSSDRIELWRKNGGSFGNKVGDFPSSPILASGALRNGLNIRVTRSALGEFELFFSTGFTYGAIPTTSAGTLTNNDVTTSSFFGVYSKFANPNDIRRVYIDNIEIGTVSACTPTQSVTDFAPISGPEGTEVTINGSGFTNSTSVMFNGVPATVTFIDATTLIAETPVGSTTGELTVTENSCDITTSDFTIINNSGSCGSLSNLIMTEIYDRDGGSLGYIEVFNGTGAPINLTNYFIRRYGDAADFAVNDFTDYFFSPGVATIADGQVIYGKISSDADTASSNFNYGNSGFSGINGLDIFELRNSSGVIDVYIVPNSNIGYTARRNTNTLGPNVTSNPSDWTHNTLENITDLGNFPYVALSNFPSVFTNPVDVTTCDLDAVFTALATPGASGTLSYQWYYNDSVASGWSLVNSGDFPLTTITGEATNQLTLGNGFANYNGYQFYCLVTEDGACGIASDAAQLNIETATWNGSWSSAPTSAKTVILNSNYDTAAQTSFSACNLIINDNVLLNIADLTYIEVINSLTANGNDAGINIEPQGSFVQVNDTGSVSATVPANLTVNKRTAPALTANEYTYWSSPVVGETIGGALSLSNSNRRYWFDAQNFRDSNAEMAGNLNVFVAGQDDIDDNADDWQQLTLSSTEMEAGVGYASTHDPFLFACTPGPPTCPDPRPGVRYEFSGLFNNGEIFVPIYRDDAERNDNNWNLIGNPYPSAIAINGPNGFLTQNATNIADVTGGAITGAIFIWSQSSAPLATTNGNENINFSQSDYAIVNGSGGVAAGGDTNGDGTIDNADRPSEFVPSGQSFFVAMSDTSPAYVGSPTIKTTNVVFNNAMRTTGNNEQFFRSSNDPSTDSANKLWLNLKTDHGVFNEILITYLDNASDADDGMYYDAPRNASTAINSVLYTFIPNVDKKFAIQSKNSRSLSTDEIIPVGFYNAITVPTIFTISLSTLEGAFLTNQPIFIKDNLLNTLHNLKDSDYTFTSDTGEFNERFEIVFRADALSVNDNQIDANALSIIELENGDVQFKVSNHLSITHVQLLDMTGRQIYNLRGHTSTEVYTLSQLSKAPYIAKVTLSNGQVIHKKAIKRH